MTSPDRLVAAYDDAQGGTAAFSTAAFNKNVPTVINRSLDGDFDVEAFAHRAAWDEEHEWIEMRLSTVDQGVRLGHLDLDIAFGRGGQMRTEILAKFRRPGVAAELAAAGLRLQHWWSDPAGDFALTLSVPDPALA